MYEFNIQLPKILSIILVKSHSGVEENELADRMCFVAMKNKVEDFKEFIGSESANALLALNAD
jgi:hypothetical protein